jgi:putative nucleotidyltransferase with HDIG domain
MKKKGTDVLEIIEGRFPGLVERTRKLIQDSETRFMGAPRGADSYLWEHTVHVASLALDLARSEKLDPVAPAVAALFHDAGKFMEGTYHQGSRPEEEDAARLAMTVLRRAGMKPRAIRHVTSALRSLYNPRAAKNKAADIVHDADFLSKFGALGVAQFFIKSTLRGQTLRNTLLSSLSKELTYAAGLPSNMRTNAGRRRAATKSRETLRFFRSLIRELREMRIADITVKRLLVRRVSRPRHSVDVRLALPRVCEKCGERWTISHEIAPGTKCEKLEAEITCTACGASSSFSFCLPEIGLRSSPIKK